MSTQKQKRESNETTESDRNATEREQCPECGSTEIVNEASEIVCKGCGLVLDDDQIDRGAEWSAFSAAEEDEKSRVGAPLTETVHDKGLSTHIGWQNRDARGNRITGRKRSQMSRLRKWQERTRAANASEQNLRQALGEVKRMTSALGLPKETEEMAAVIYRRALKEDLLRGRSIEGMASGAVYAACRQGNIARTLDEISTVSRVEYREIARTYKYLIGELGLKMEPTSPKTYIPRFASKLDLNHETEEKAKQIVDESMDQGVHSGKSPPAFAAGAIYAANLICDEDLTQKEIGDVAQVSEVTIRNRYQEQLEAMGIKA